MMTIQEAEQLRKLGKKVLDPEVWDEVQRLTDPSAKFGPKVLGGKVPPSEHYSVVDKDGYIEIASNRPRAMIEPKAKKEK
jgi:hypothetical protein